MAGVLAALYTACSFVTSDKISERKKQIEAVKKELNNRQALRELDSKKNGWDHIFNSVWGYIQKELELLEKGAREKSGRASTTNSQRKGDIQSKLRWIIAVANARGPQLHCSTMVKALLSLLNNEYRCAEFGGDCCAVLTKEVLGCQKYWCELSQDDWQDLLKAVTLALHKSPSGTTSDSHAKAVQCLVAGATIQGRVPTGHMFKFFSKMLQRMKSEKSVTVVSCILSALNSFSLWAAPDCRHQLAKLGEDSFNCLISTWKTNSTVIKDELVKFFQYQMMIHHPNGVTAEKEGVFAADYDLWKECLTTLCEELMKEWKQQAAKLKLKTSGKEEVLFSQDIVDLAADVCHQVFRAGSMPFEATQMGTQPMSTGRMSSQATTPAKRRRLDTGWELLREHIGRPSQHTSLVPWLQLILTILTKYPEDLPEQEFHPYLMALHQLQAQSKRGKLQIWVLKCLQAFASSQKVREDLSLTTKENLGRAWTKIWAATMRTICLHSAEDEGFDLLTSLLHHSIVKPDREVWKLFLPEVIKPSNCSVRFLATLLHLNPVPENHVCEVGLLASMTGVLKRQHPLRHQLLDWLLPAEEVEEAGERLVVIPKILQSVSPDTLAHVLTVLIAKNCSSLQPPDDIDFLGCTRSATQSRLSTIADLYLRSGFHLPLARPAGGCLRGGDTATPSSGGVVITSMVDSILERISFVTTQLQDTQSREVDHYESVGHLARLQVAVMTGISNHFPEAVKGGLKDTLTKHIKVLLKRLTTGLKEMCTPRTDSITDSAKSQTHSLLTLTSVLLSLYECQGTNQREGDRLVAHLLRSLTPSELLDNLLNLVHNKGSRIRQGSKVSGRDLFGDAMDQGSDDEFPSTQTQRDLDDEFGDVSTSTSVMRSTSSSSSGRMEKDHSGTSSGTHSLLSVDRLSPEEQLAIRCASLLSAWCWSPDTSTSSQLTTAAGSRGVNRDVVTQKILEELDEEKWDESSPYGIQLFFAVAANVALDWTRVEDSELLSVLNAWRALVSANRRVQEVCLEALKFLHAVSPRLSSTSDDDMVSSDIQESRDVAVFILNAFWQLKSTYSAPVKCQLAVCMEAFIRADPEGQWTIMRSKGREKGQGDSDERSKVKTKFPSLLRDGAHEIRMHMTSAVGCLFYRSPGHPHKSDIQNQVFDTIYQTLQEAMEIPDGLTGSEAREEATNRRASLLLTLANIVVKSPVCEKKAIFALLQTTQINQMSTTLLAKVLDCIAQSIPSCESGLELAKLNLSYLVHQWLQENYVIGKFPYALLGCSSTKDFLRKHHMTIVPHLATRKEFDVIQSITEDLNMDVAALLRASFPRTIASLLPLLADSDESEEDKGDQEERAAWAVLCLGELETAIGKDTRDAWIRTHLDSIVVELLTMLREPCGGSSESSRFTTDCDPEPHPPYFSSYVIQATLDYLTKCHAGGSSLTLISLLSKSHDSIQKVLLELHIRMAKSCQPHEHHRLLLAYRLFALLLVRELGTTLGGSWVFVLQDLVYTIVHTITRSQTGSLEGLGVGQVSSLVPPCLDLLHRLSEVAMEKCTDEFTNHVSVILRAVVPLVECSDDVISREAISLVQLLVEKSSRTQRAMLQYTNPLPAKMRKARALLAQSSRDSENCDFSQEVSYFLRSGGQQSKGHTPEGLDRLRGHLASRKAELAELLTKCAGDCSTSLLPRLICELVSICGSCHGNPDKEAQMLISGAAKCLGEIGAPDLSMIAIKTGQQEDNASYGPAVKAFREAGDTVGARNAIILHLLKDYLTDPCVDTIEASASCLKSILATPSGRQFYEKYKDLQTDHLLAYLHPFRTPKKKAAALPSLDTSDEAFIHSICEESLWQPADGSHEQWLRNLTVALLRSGGVRDEILRLLEPVCVAKVEFAERVFPFLIHNILAVNNIVYRQILSEQVKAVFACFTESSCTRGRSVTPMPSSQDYRGQPLGQRSIKTLLDTIHYLRNQPRKSGQKRFTPWDNNFWLDVDYLVVAKAAQMCQAHFTCLLYSEMWCNAQRMEGSLSTNPVTIEPFSQDSGDSVSLGSLAGETGINVQSLLMEAFGSIGEPDSMYGCGAGRLVNTDARIHTYEHEREWGKALAAYDLQMKSSTNENSQLGLLQAMQNFGLTNIMQTYLEGHKSVGGQDYDPALAEYQFEAAWRNSVWDLDIEESPADKDSLSYHHNIFSALSSLRSRDKTSFDRSVERASLGLAHQLAEASMESVQHIYPVLARLQGLVELQDWAPVVLSGDADPQPVLAKWRSQLVLMANEFDFSEPILTLRSTLLHMVPQGGDRDRQQAMHDGIAGHLKTQIQWARDAGRFQVAERALLKLKELEDRSTSTEGCSSALEEAQLFWAKNERTTALHLMKAVTNQLSKAHSSNPARYKTYAATLSLHGNWLAETRSQSPNIILEEYLEKSANIFDSNNDTSQPAIAAYHTLARFADNQYQRLVDYMKSKEYEAKRALLKSSQSKVEKLSALGLANTTDKYFRILQKQSAIDKQEVDSLREDRDRFLYRSMECYLRCLESSEETQDIRVFRVCSLWFENTTDDEINRLLEESLTRVESRRFLPMMYQLAARMTTKTQGKERFHGNLTGLMRRMGADHPHHALPVILALANADKDSIITASSRPRLARSNSGVNELSNSDKDRMQAARDVCSHLQKTSPCNEIIDSMNKLSDAYVRLAYWDVKQFKKETRPIRIPPNQPLLQIKSLQHVALPTLELEVDPSCRYDNMVYVEGFEPTFKLAGGLNLPKIISCMGSDGVKRRQLVKGNDDLRQDAVMQQVFGLVNQLLRRNTETNRRKLQIRRYKVVPLCQKSGLLEWCEGTMPLGLYLVGDSRTDHGAHKRYRPSDWSAMQCRGKMAAAHQAGDYSTKYREFSKVCKYFQPVFHHFFLERFLDPADWFEKRLSYTRSVATGSIVGYVVGLGDRHVQNILIDCKTAELVHIDLGIAFEQGRNLPTPETVPFRLTRDLVDAMGVAGVEGVFRRCSEKTMEVMHNSREALLTVVEVLLYDPLYTWTMSPSRALALQALDRTEAGEASELNATGADTHDVLPDDDDGAGNGREDVNQVAERVLMRLRQKLGGLEDGVALSVEGQVSLLIQEARDPKNLSRLFPGWQPWI
ncbi:serine-protein kinase ATM-like [Diadema antillarum]|uniref:serine-protein kinase ATM-like n=1 Tax=Diadema antillarum TaxID=105358 RepID=UPI003A8ABAC3